MCRFYALRASEPTRVECGLVHAQNALMSQSQGDSEGLIHGHGWGVADYPDGLPKIEKQVWAAWEGEHFKKQAARVYAHTVIAHVRRATVGLPSITNTHPFDHGHWIFAHNGTVPSFELIRERLLERTDRMHRDEIHGTTDSEHIFRYLLTLWSHHTDMKLVDVLRLCLQNVVAWCHELAPGKPIGLNVVLTDGDQMVGSRLGRTLWFLEREDLFKCDICGRTHVHHDPKATYRSVEIASEPVTDEPGWKRVPDSIVYNVDPDYRLNFAPL